MSATITPINIAHRREAVMSTINTDDRLTTNLRRAMIAYIAAYGIEALKLEAQRAVINECVEK